MSGFCARREMPSLVSDALASRAGSAVVQPRAHKNFRLRRAPGNSRCPTCPAPENRCGQGKKSVPQTHFVREPVVKGPAALVR